ncbi:hypothetical protein WT60_28195 [Burkholderia sp. MSMB617WGS]|uniref:hypothetical protein n=1 Tax=Burkholderia sp. MSMB617WGS TaxID=1637831 RepID=UPI00075FF3BB|nr:hypothetical protein [Burkholderia sp. MSMB617WGS]AOK50658.1 hypothetical protein WT60_28195 [Burkholderia sp. MSMB617WGS]
MIEAPVGRAYREIDGKPARMPSVRSLAKPIILEAEAEAEAEANANANANANAGAGAGAEVESLEGLKA